MLRTFTIRSIVLAAATLANVDAALAADVKSAIADCEPGAHAQLPENQSRRRGDTPLAVAGAVTVSAAEAKCLMNKLGKELVVVAAVNDERKLPGAVRMAWAAGNGIAVQDTLSAELATLTTGRTSRPLLVYCHHTACALSPRVAERMVSAGYQHVFWLRSGMDGWEKAGLAFEGEVEKDPAQRYAKDVDDCGVEIDRESIAYIVAQNPQHAVEGEIAARLADEKESRKSCLEEIMPTVTEGKRRKADLAQRIARSDAEVALAMKEARAAFNANPAGALVPLLTAARVEALRETIAVASTVRSLSARCGYYDFTIPHLNNAALARMRQRMDAYRACMDEVKSERFTRFMNVDEFRSAARLAEFTRPYTCSATPRPNCVPDHAWLRVGQVATPNQLQVVDLADRTLGQLDAELDRMHTRLNEHADAVNARIAEINRQNVNNNSGYGYSGNNSYTPPAPTTYRRPSDTSAAGIR